jgi:hypothetical protein
MKILIIFYLLEYLFILYTILMISISILNWNWNYLNSFVRFVNLKNSFLKWIEDLEVSVWIFCYQFKWDFILNIYRPFKLLLQTKSIKELITYFILIFIIFFITLLEYDKFKVSTQLKAVRLPILRSTNNL